MKPLKSSKEVYDRLQANDVQWFLALGKEHLEGNLFLHRLFESMPEKTIGLFAGLLDAGYVPSVRMAKFLESLSSHIPANVFDKRDFFDKLAAVRLRVLNAIVGQIKSVPPSGETVAYLVNFWRYIPESKFHIIAEKKLLKLGRPFLVNCAVRQLETTYDMEKRMQYFYLLNHLFSGKKFPNETLPGLCRLLGDLDRINAINKTIREGQRVIEQLEAFGPLAIPGLEEVLLKTKSTVVISAAMRILSKIEDLPERTQDLFFKFLSNADIFSYNTLTSIAIDGRNKRLRNYAKVVRFDISVAAELSLAEIREIMNDHLARFAGDPKAQSKERGALSHFYRSLFREKNMRTRVVSLPDQGILSTSTIVLPKGRVFRERVGRVYA